MSKFPALVIGAALMAGAAQAGTVIPFTNTFDLGQTLPAGVIGNSAPMAPTSANGLDALGVLFGFTEGASLMGATYGDTVNTAGNGIEPPLHDPVLDGGADGILTLNFNFPSTFLKFDIALFVMDGVSSGGQVTIGGNTRTFNTSCVDPSSCLFSVASFSWTPADAFNQAVITFDSNAMMFAIDNLSYDVDPPATGAAPVGATPEPATVVFMASGALLLGLARLRRRRP